MSRDHPVSSAPEATFETHASAKGKGLRENAERSKSGADEEAAGADAFACRCHHEAGTVGVVVHTTTPFAHLLKAHDVVVMISSQIFGKLRTI